MGNVLYLQYAHARTACGSTTYVVDCRGMPISFAPPLGALIGNGTNFGLTVSGFPVVAGDIVSLTLQDVTATLNLVGAAVVVDGGGNGVGNFGLIQTGGAGAPVVVTAYNGGTQGLAFGTAIQVFWEWIRLVPFTIIDSGTITGYQWDPVSNISGIFNLSGSGLTSAQQTELDTILSNTEGGTFHFPLIGIVTTSLDPASPIPGAAVTNLTVPSATQVLGVTWQVNTPSPTSGETIGVIAEWSKRLLQIVVFHSLAGGATFADQVFETHADSGTLWFDSADPAGVTVFVWPAFTVDVSWLVIP